MEIRKILRHKELLLLLFIVLIAILIRFHGVNTRSISGDEEWVAIAVSQDNLTDVFSKTDSIYSFLSDSELIKSALTPPFFLTVAYFMTNLFENSELTLRLLPFIFGVGAVLLIFILSRKLTKSIHVSLLATSILAFNIRMIYYSKELKQYSGDIFFSLLLFYLCEIYLEKRSWKSFVLLLGASILTIGFSHPGIFFVCVVVMRILYKLLSNKAHRGSLLLQFAIYSSSLTLWFGWIYWTFLKLQSSSSFVYSAWSEAFPIGLSSFFPWLGKTVIQFFLYLFAGSADQFYLQHNPLVYYAGAMFVLFCISVALLISSHKRKILFYTFIPIGITILAAIFHKFPFSATRVNLYLAPMRFICIAYGLMYLLNIVKKRFGTKIFYILFVAVIFLPSIPAINAERNMFNYPNPIYPNSGMRDLMKTYLDERSPEDITYVYYSAKLGFMYYYEHYYKNKDYTNVYLSGGDKWYGQTEWINETNQTYKSHQLNYLQDEVYPLIIKLKGQANQRLWMFFSAGLLSDDTVMMRVYMQNLCGEIGKYGKYDAKAYIYDCSNVDIYKLIAIEKENHPNEPYNLSISINNDPLRPYSVEENRFLD